MLARNLKQTLPTALLLLLALRNTPTLATEWLGNTGSFSDSSQWSPSAPPTPADTATFNNGGTLLFDADATTLRALITGTTPATFTLDSPDLTGSQGTISHIYTLADSAPGALSATNANLTITGGALSLPNSGLSLTNSSLQLGPNAHVTANALSTIDSGSLMSLSSQSSFTASDVIVAGTGAGSLVIGPHATTSVNHDLSLAPQSGSNAQLLVQSGSLTVSGTLYVGGSAAGPGGTANVRVASFNNTFADSSLTADHLVVNTGSTLLTNQCAGIFTRVSDIAGSLQFLSADGSGGGLQASQAINLLPNSLTTLQGSTFLNSPAVTLSSGAILSGSGYVAGNLINGGEVSAKLTIYPFGQPPASYTQLASGTLIVAATPNGSDSALTLLSGTASLDGKLRLLFDNPTTLHAGDSFQIISASAITGSFSSIDLVGITGFTPFFSTTTGRLTLLSSDDTGNGDNTVGDAQPPLPEPASLPLLALATSVLLTHLHRRRPISP